MSIGIVSKTIVIIVVIIIWKNGMCIAQAVIILPKITTILWTTGTIGNGSITAGKIDPLNATPGNSLLLVVFFHGVSEKRIFCQ